MSTEFDEGLREHIARVEEGIGGSAGCAEDFEAALDASDPVWESAARRIRESVRVRIEAVPVDPFEAVDSRMLEEMSEACQTSVDELIANRWAAGEELDDSLMDAARHALVRTAAGNGARGDEDGGEREEAEAAVADAMANGHEVPRCGGRTSVLTQLKAILYQTMSRDGLQIEDLARRLDWTAGRTVRTLDVAKGCGTDDIERALAAVGIQIRIEARRVSAGGP